MSGYAWPEGATIEALNAASAGTLMQALLPRVSASAGMLMAGGNAVVGLEINANHLRAVRSGIVTGTARPLHVGRSTQVWEIRIEDEGGKPVCISRITLAVLPRPPASGQA